jgi:phenylacetate-CoA ligase
MTAALGDRWDRATLESYQQRQLLALIKEIIPRNRFYQHKLAQAGLTDKDIRTLADLVRVPFTTKDEIIADQGNHPPYGRILTYPLERYCRMHQTSGTSGRPLRWLDTRESWDQLLDRWETIYRIAGIDLGDRLFFAFSFGPFIGFWSAFEAASRRGHLSLPGGGMSSGARLRFLLENEITVVLCTPTYALRLAEVACEEKIDLASSAVRALIVAGEPGGCVATTRGRIEKAWRARVFDHCGMTEIGPLGIECPENPCGLHLLETDCLIEVIDPVTEGSVPAGEVGELVLTNLERWGSPLLRYRTGDLVSVDPEPCACGRVLARLKNGILGRTDEMIHIRGNNFYPSALESLIGRFSEVAEYQVEIDESGSLPVVRIELEPVAGSGSDNLGQRVARAVQEEFLFRADVKTAPPGSLPRFEMKARRVHRKRREQS